MARNTTKGTSQVGHAVDADLWARFTAFCRDRNEKIRQHLEMAMERHLANPPGPLKPVAPPLPPVTTPLPDPPPKKGRKKGETR